MLEFKDEILLSKYFDQELGWWGRRRSEKLLGENQAASDFYNSLCELSGQITCEHSRSVEMAGVDLWPKISQRISNEIEAAKLEGAIDPSRRFVDISSRTHSLWHGIFSTNTLWSGLSGAATAAVILLVAFGNQATSPGVLTTANNSARNSSSSISSVAASSVAVAKNSAADQVGSPRTMTVSSRRSDRVSSFNGGMGNFNALSSSRQQSTLLNGSPTAFEVDWMRGEGPLRVIQQPNDTGAIIWVTRPRVRANKANQHARESGANLILTASPVGAPR